MKLSRRFVTSVLLVLAVAGAGLQAQPVRQAAAPATDEAKILEAMHLIPSQTLYDYVKELVSEKYGGRLTGTPEYEACASGSVGLLKGWGVQPGGDNGTYLPALPEPLHPRPAGRRLRDARPGREGRRHQEVLPVRGRVHPRRHVGLGRGHGRGRLSSATASPRPSSATTTTQGVDVKGKIVLMDPEVPLRAGRSPRGLQEVAALLLPSVQARERRGPRGQGHDLQLRPDRQSQQLLPRGLRLPSRRRGRRGRRLRRHGPRATPTSWPRSARSSSRSPSPRARP